MYVYIYIYMHTSDLDSHIHRYTIICLCVTIYIYLHTEMERERERENFSESLTPLLQCSCRDVRRYIPVASIAFLYRSTQVTKTESSARCSAPNAEH